MNLFIYLPLTKTAIMDNANRSVAVEAEEFLESCAIFIDPCGNKVITPNSCYYLSPDSLIECQYRGEGFFKS